MASTRASRPAAGGADAGTLRSAGGAGTGATEGAAAPRGAKRARASSVDCIREWRGTGLPSGPTFSVVSWNVQAARLRKGNDGNDCSMLLACLDKVLEGSLSKGAPPDILVLLELQRCKRQTQRRDCRFCKTRSCRQEHAEVVHERLVSNGYDGRFHARHMVHTVGLYFRRDVFTSSTIDGRILFAHFDSAREPTNKGAVLAVLQHRETGARFIAAAVHLSVPIRPDGTHDTARPLHECSRLNEKIEDVREREGLYLPLLLAGDFNSDPVKIRGHAPPDVYKLLTGRSSGWGLTSAYRAIVGHEPRITAWSDVFEGCLDYILFSAGLQAHSVLAVPDELSDEDKVLSDHLPVCATISIRSLDRV